MTQRFMIIGGGARGLFFTEILEKELQCKVVAIVENNKPGHLFIHRRLEQAGITGVDIFEDVDTAMSNYPAASIDGVFIMTPEWTHTALFKTVTQQGYAVFLEKPVATTKADALTIREIAQHYPNVIQIGFVLRYSPFYRQVKTWLTEANLGKVVMMQLNGRLTIDHGTKFKRSWHRKVAYTGGYLNEKCSHDLDMMCWFMEKQAHPVLVASVGQRGFAQTSVGETTCTRCQRTDCLYRDDPTSYAKSVDGKVLLDNTAAVGTCIYGNDSDVHDHQTVLIQFSDGSHGVFSSVAMSGIDGSDLTIHLEYGVIWGNLEHGELYCRDYRTDLTQQVHFDGMDGHGGGDSQIVREFIECVAAQRAPIASVADGVLATLLALAADESAATQSVIKLAE